LRFHCSGPDASEINADSTLKQALLNLINNAADASPEAVEAQANWDDTALVIDILDRGPGITREVREKLGRSFFTTKAPGERLGMGFLMANKAIELCGGSVVLFNREGGGACARVSLPLALRGKVRGD
jgi:two-component system sensor histidine kinase RegB